jgi:hypothetical protein
VKFTGLLAFMLGATNTTKGPEVAPDGMVMVMDVALQDLIVTAVWFSSTTLLPCKSPNPVPPITTWLPITPFVAETLVITGAGAELELTETLSNVAVARAVVLPLVAANPTYTVCPMLIVWLVPNGTQFTPSEDV